MPHPIGYYSSTTRSTIPQTLKCLISQIHNTTLTSPGSKPTHSILEPVDKNLTTIQTPIRIKSEDHNRNRLHEHELRLPLAPTCGNEALQDHHPQPRPTPLHVILSIHAKRSHAIKWRDRPARWRDRLRSFVPIARILVSQVRGLRSDFRDGRRLKATATWGERKEGTGGFTNFPDLPSGACPVGGHIRGHVQ